MEVLRRNGEVAKKLVRALLALPGVAEIYIKPYEVLIEKGLAFDWEEIEPEIISVLSETIKAQEPTSEIVVEGGQEPKN